jgi:hypothetical protein
MTKRKLVCDSIHASDETRVSRADGFDYMNYAGVGATVCPVSDRACRRNRHDLGSSSSRASGERRSMCHRKERDLRRGASQRPEAKRGIFSKVSIDKRRNASATRRHGAERECVCEGETEARCPAWRQDRPSYGLLRAARSKNQVLQILLDNHVLYRHHRDFK